MIAPLLGGLFTTYLSWHWIFLVNLPLGVVAFAVAVRLVRNVAQDPPPALDWVGLALTCSAVAALVVLADVLAGARVAWVSAVALGVLATALVTAAVRHLLRTRHPLLQLDILSVSTFLISHRGGSLFRVTVNAVPFLLPLMFQDAFGWSPLKSGVVVLFVFIGNLTIKPATTPLLMRFGFRAVMLGATAGAAASMVGNGLLTADTPLALTCALLVFGGMARSIGFTAYNTLAFADIPPGDLPAANTLSSTVQQVAVGFGVAIGAVALRAGDPIGRWTGLQLPVAPYRVAFFLLAALTVLPVLESWRASRTSGNALRAGRS